MRMVAVTVGSATQFFDVPAHKDIDTQTVVDLRRMLSSAGYGPTVEEAGARELAGLTAAPACPAARTHEATSPRGCSGLTR